MKLSQIFPLFENCSTCTAVPFFDTDISLICFDSRQATKNCVFVAIKGVKTDGHLYIQSAIDSGAVAIICEEKNSFEEFSKKYPSISFILTDNARISLAIISKAFYENACDKLKIIGLTGTKGKTSTSYMIQSVLNHAGKKCAIIGTNGAKFESFYKELNHSTPESLVLHELFSTFLSMGARYVVMEVSSQALMMHRVYGLHFETAVFTNLSPDHIGHGEHTSYEHYFSCKAKLFSMCKNAVVNIDSDKADDILKICRQNNVSTITYSCSNKSADYIAKDERFYIDGGMKTQFTICSEKYSINQNIQVGVPGKFSVFNALCALTVAFSIGLLLDSIKDALINVKVIGRIEPVICDKLKVPVIIDYAHNAVSLESLFEAVKAYNPKRMICVFGCGGNRSKLRRYEMGEVSGKYAELSIITADNSRFEKLDDIISDILVGMHKTSGKYEIIHDRKMAIYHAIDIAQEGDVVLLAGKGQETYLDVNGVKTHFDEREVVLSYFDR